MGTGLKKVEDRITDYINKTIDKGRDSRAFFARYVRTAFIEAQKKRFETDNSTQGTKWVPLNPNYAKHKLEKFKDFPGGGTHINVATGALRAAMTLQPRESVKALKERKQEGRDFKELYFETSYIINFGIPYAKAVDDVRPIIQFKKEFYDDLKKKCTQWMLGGKV